MESTKRDYRVIAYVFLKNAEDYKKINADTYEDYIPYAAHVGIVDYKYYMYDLITERQYSFSELLSKGYYVIINTENTKKPHKKSVDKTEICYLFAPCTPIQIAVYQRNNYLKRVAGYIRIDDRSDGMFIKEPEELMGMLGYTRNRQLEPDGRYVYEKGTSSYSFHCPVYKGEYLTNLSVSELIKGLKQGGIKCSVEPVESEAYVVKLVVEDSGNEGSSKEIVTLTQMQLVERTDTQGNVVEAWRFNSLRDILSWSPSTYIPTYTAYRSIEQKDVDAINACLEKYNITGDQVAHFIAQCSHECGCGASGIEKYGGSDPATYFRDRDIWRENFDAGDLAATSSIWNNKTAIEQYALANNLGTKYKDYGAKYRGSGALQMTHYCEYKPYSDYIGDSTILTEGAGRVAEAYFWDSAGWLWKEYYKMHEKFANGAVPTVKDITYKINGGYNGLAERENFYKCCKTLF